MDNVKSRSRCVLALGLLALFGSVMAEAPPVSVVPRFETRVPHVAATNLLRNASFECGPDSWSTLGAPTAWGGDLSGLYGKVIRTESWDGQRCLAIEMGPGTTPETSFDVWPPSHVVQHAPLAGNLGWMIVPKGKPLTLSAYLRSTVPGTKARLQFRFAGNAMEGVRTAAQDVVLSTEWKRYSFTHEALEEDVCIAVGPDMSSMPDVAATVYIDAVELESGTGPTGFQPREPVEGGFDSSRYGNVYGAGSPVVITVYASNRRPSAATVVLVLRWEDYFGETLEPQHLSLTVPASSNLEEAWSIPVPAKGLFRARISWSVDGHEQARAMKFAVVDPYRHDDSPFGLNHPATTRRQLELLGRCGLRWVRNWSVNWGWVEPVQGQITWKEPDAQFEFLTPTGLRNLVVFPNPSTNWSSEAPEDVNASLWHRMAYAPREPSLLFHFIRNAVTRYAAHANHWEFLNEPLWVPDFCLPMKGGYKVADYIELLKGASKAIREADPNGKIVAGLSIDPKSPLGDDFIAAGGLQYCDILNLHPYGGRTLPEEFIADMARIQNLMDANGGRKPIWATETGYYAADDKPWQPWVVPKGHFSAELLLESERVAADYIVRHALILLAHGVEKLFYHEPLDGPLNNGAMDIENPFLAEEGIPKKSFVVLSALANLLGPAPQFCGVATFPEDAMKVGATCLGYAFQCDDRAVVALWSPHASLALDGVALSPEVTTYNVVGNVTTGTLTLGNSPVYLVSRSMKADELARRWHESGVTIAK